MKQIKISVIIPVYNTQLYVRQAVESITQQTLHELEIILINDGSTDRSGAILRELATKDERISVYEQRNQGPSITRNKGLTHATGLYVYFMDSDDLLSVDALEVCYKKVTEQKLDFVCFDATLFSDNSVTYRMNLKYNRESCLIENKVYTGPEIMLAQLKQEKYTPSPCLTLFQRKLLIEKEITFYPGILHEDQLFNAVYYLQAARGTYINRKFFQRRMRSDSIITTRFAWRNIEGYLTVTHELLHFRVDQSSEINMVIHLLLSQMLDAAVWQAHTLPLMQKIKIFRICLFKYHKYISYRTLAVLLLKKTRIN